jgi:aspartate racemase
MKPKPIGIIGGAGPMAGLSLLERIFSLSRDTYGCWKDQDFPEVRFLSFPFSEMLSAEMDAAKVQKELSECLNDLRESGSAVLAIACNTLHAFLDDKENQADLVHFAQALAEEIPPKEKPLVLCTSTSARFGLHRKFFPCCYPDSQTQEQIDALIEEILKGAEETAIAQQLLKILQAQPETTMILGCTELSLLTDQLSSCIKRIIDPLEIVAKKILEKSFLT